jgi:CheY-like chemotaxis protein
MFEMPSGGFFLINGFFRKEGMPLSGGEDSSEPQRSLPKILVVDDERRIADTLAEILKMSGFEVVAAYGGWEALETVARFRRDYLLSDVLMPRMNGVDLAIAIRKMYPEAKILLLSGQAGISEILLGGQRRALSLN